MRCGAMRMCQIPAAGWTPSVKDLTDKRTRRTGANIDTCAPDAVQSGSSNPKNKADSQFIASKSLIREESVPSTVPAPHSIGTVIGVPECPQGLADQSKHPRQYLG